MEVVGISFKSRTNGAEVRTPETDDVMIDPEDERVPSSRPTACRVIRERFQTFSPQSRDSVFLPTATAPKRGMIRLTALRGELENPRMYFTGVSSIPSASSTGRLERMRRTAGPRRSPEKRICGVSYTPESLQSFGRQVTLTELHRTVDSLIVHSANKRDSGWNLPHIQQLDREVTRLIDSTDRHLLYRDDLPRLQQNTHDS